MRKIENKSAKLGVNLELTQLPAILGSSCKTFFSNLDKGIFSAAVSAVPDILGLFGVDLKNTIGAQAFGAYFLAFTQSIYEVLHEQNEQNMKPTEFKIPKKLNLKKSYNFEEFSKSNPTALELYDDLRKEFYNILVEQGIPEESATQIVNSVRSKFSNNLNLIIADKPEFNSFYKYYEISDVINLDECFEKQRILSINECSKPLSIDPDLNLDEIYVTPSCRYKFYDDFKDDNNKNEQEDKGEFKDNLLDEVKQKVADTTADNYIIFIKGQPGHGKTSFVKYFLKKMAYAKTINDPEYIPLYISLSKLAIHLKVDKDIFKAIAKLIELPESPETYFKTRDTILVLDGLDEILIANNKGYQENIEYAIIQLNQSIKNNPKFKVIITSRSQCFDTHKNTFPFKYHLFEILDFTENKDGDKVEKQKVNIWIDKYKSLKPSCKKNFKNLSIENFKIHNLAHFIGQPVLLTFIAQLFIDDNFLKDIKQDGEIKSRADIYGKIVDHTLCRKWAEKSRNRHISNKYIPEYVDLNKKVLNKIGYSIFTTQNSTDPTTTTKTEIEREIKNKINEKDLKQEDFLDVTKIMFYFKETDLFEFAHLSFRDYFTALDIIDSLKKWSSTKDQDNLIIQLYELLGYRMLDSDQLDFLNDIVKNEDKEICSKIAVFLSDRFAEFKKHDHITKIKQDKKFNAEVFVLKNILPLIIIFKQDDKNIYEFEDILDYLRYRNFLGSFEYSLSIFFIDKINFKTKDLVNGFIPRANLSGVNLSGANLSGANLSRADLWHADLSGANLSGANLRETKLSGANLSDANLRHANLSRANLLMANLSRADLTRADLFGAYMTDANLRDAKLSSAYLSSAYLRDAKLNGTELNGADLSGADLNRAELKCARNITVSQIKSARNWQLAIYDDEFRKELGLE